MKLLHNLILVSILVVRTKGHVILLNTLINIRSLNKKKRDKNLHIKLVVPEHFQNSENFNNL